MNFCRLWAIFLISVFPGLGFAAGRESVQVTLDYIAMKAEERARKPFRSPRLDLPAVLCQPNLDYDKYREIEFRHERALWVSDAMPFRIEFFHPGYIYHEPVRVNEFTLTLTQLIRFVQDFLPVRECAGTDPYRGRTRLEHGRSARAVAHGHAGQMAGSISFPGAVAKGVCGCDAGCVSARRSGFSSIPNDAAPP